MEKSRLKGLEHLFGIDKFTTNVGEKCYLWSVKEFAIRPNSITKFL